MSNVKISDLTENTNPSGSEELVYAVNGTNWKVTLDTVKTFVKPDGAYIFKWTVETFNNLPQSWMVNWDVYNVEAEFELSWKVYPAGTDVAWNGSAWNPLWWNAEVDNTAYGSSWDWQTSKAPSKNAVYDKINSMDTAISWKQDTINDLETIRSWASAWATATQPADVLTKTNTTAFTPSANYHPATKKYVDDNAVTFKPFPAWLDTTHTTQDFLDSVAALNLPAWSAYLWQVSTNDMPAWVSVQGDVEVYVYPQNVIYAVMRSAEVAPYIWSVNSYDYRGREPEANLVTGATAPDYPTQWMLWYDTTEDKLKTFDGTDWNECWGWATYNAWIWIKIETLYDTQWPCDSWWHVPSYDEATALVTYLTTLWIDMANENYLKIPFAWDIYDYNGLHTGSGTYWVLYTSTIYHPAGTSENTYNAYTIMFNYYSNKFRIKTSRDDPSEGCSIRPFKNEPVIPDNERTTLFDWSSVANGAWIFYDATNWLISISEDWENRLTIADKNLWATTVYAEWDVLSEANCGKFYQWWNNYGFPRGPATNFLVSTQFDVTSCKPSQYASNQFSTNSMWFVDSSIDRYSSRNLWWDLSKSYTENWISNTWVLSINWQNGHININIEDEVVISSAFPSSPYEWLCCFNTSLWKLFAYNWEDWIEPWITYSARNWIALEPAGQDITKMQWPCDDWFHVPTVSEITDIKNYLAALWISGKSNISSYLHLPAFERGVDWNIDTTTYYDYWTSSVNDSWRPYEAYMNSSWTITFTAYSSRHWLPVRPYKDTPVAPDNTWTMTFDWSGLAQGAWIFEDSTNWLISISINWTEWITIADKNIWASTVYTSWDTVSESNSWFSFQWWNCYWFPWINWVWADGQWTIYFVSWSIDVTWFWADTPYSSSTYYTGTSSTEWFSWDWSDLWWYISWQPQGQAFVNTWVLSINWQNWHVVIPTWTNYSWVEKQITNWEVELWLRTIVNNTGSWFTLTAPATLLDGEEYVIRINNLYDAVTAWDEIVLGTWFSDPWNTDLSLSSYASDQFVFLAINWVLELQPEVMSWNGWAPL